MARMPRWTEEREDGVLTIHLSSWNYFDDYVNQKIVEYKNYIFRGQASSKWILEPTLDRLLKKNKLTHDPYIRQKHLDNFKLATRGRRGISPNDLTEENDWWALGQHFGLSTPLLDWTYSPFVAAYFAFAPESNGLSSHRTIYGLQNILIEQRCQGLHGDEAIDFNEHLSTFIPMTDENSRLVSQNGLFTRAPDGMGIETWVRKYFKGFKKGVLIKIIIPNKCRDLALINLHRMNINHSSLFPDLYGSSKHCNLHISVYRK